MNIYIGGEEPKNQPWSHNFDEVLRAELDIVAPLEQQNTAATSEPEASVPIKGRAADSLERARQARLLGLAFSGGGIRSATFNLGVLQSLAKRKLLPKIHYLSTVSGGGYIGSWLMSWLLRRGMADVETGLHPSWAKQPTNKEEPPEIRTLRRYSNYLTPQLGWFGADLWTVIAIYIRNLLLNLIVLVCALSIILLAPRWLGREMLKFAYQAPMTGQLLILVVLAWLGVVWHYRDWKLGLRSLGYLGAAWLLQHFLDAWLTTQGGVTWGLPLSAWLLAAAGIAANVRKFRAERERRPDGKLLPPMEGVEDISEEFKSPSTKEAASAKPDAPNNKDVTMWGTCFRFLPDVLQDFSLRLEMAPRSRLPAVWLHAPRNPTGRQTTSEALELDSSTGAVVEIVSEAGVYTIRVDNKTIRRSRRTTAEEGSMGVEVGPDITFAHVYLRRLAPASKWWETQTGIQLSIVLPIVVGCFLLAAIIFRKTMDSALAGFFLPKTGNPALSGFFDLKTMDSTLGRFCHLRTLDSALAHYFPFHQPTDPVPATWQEFILAGFLFGCAVVLAGLLLRGLRGGAGSLWNVRPWLQRKTRFAFTRESVKHSGWSRTLTIWARVADDVRAALAMPAACAAVAGVLYLSTGIFDQLWKALTFGPPVLLGCAVLAISLFLGLIGLGYKDHVREWWSRLAAWLLIPAVVWVAVSLTALYVPALVRWGLAYGKITMGTLGVGWIATTIGGLLAAKSPTTGTPRASRSSELLAGVAPYIFIFGLFAILSWGIDELFIKTTTDNFYADRPAQLGAALGATERPGTSDVQWPEIHQPSYLNPDRRLKSVGLVLSEQAELLNEVHDQQQLATGGRNPFFDPIFQVLFGAGGIAFLLSWRLDINQFSMHMLYRNRLVRCYLGATNDGPRVPQSFTGFDPFDDCKLEDLTQLYGADRHQPAQGRRAGPYPIINAALNLAGGTQLEWQERKAASFVFTPRYCGYDFADLPPGFVRTEEYARAITPSTAENEQQAALRHAKELLARPLTLGTAMAVSGAAASPNSGYHTSPAPAFLMTVFNARLGWWLGNTRDQRGFTKSSPALLIFHLLRELFGLTSAHDRYVYLSDGGHFENLGIYELVRRRCRFIIACDAEEDHDFTFGGLGSAIEKCRSDFGVEIEIDVEPIRRRNESGQSQWHCAVGRIHYSNVDGGREQGTLLYIKSSLTGDEPTDVLRYRDANPEFPHQSTGDQWFDESQFESYRRLGLHVMEEVLEQAFDGVKKPESLSIDELFLNLQRNWYPPTPAGASFSTHASAVVDLCERIRANPNLAFLTEQVIPEWNQFDLVKAAAGRAAEFKVPAQRTDLQRPWLPTEIAELRDGFCICNAMLNLMENVYHDLNLEQYHESPDNRGWINLFRHWAWSEMLRVTWTISACTFGSRFQNFCQTQLDLRIGTVFLGEKEVSATALLEQPGQAQGFNRLEVALLQLFFEQNPGDQEAAVLIPLQLSPEEDRVKRPDAPVFTFGFAIVQPMRRADGTIPRDERGRDYWKVLYLRVQDHLRKMGLARRACTRLVEDRRRAFVLDLKRMHPKAHEVPTDEDIQTFVSLFNAEKAVEVQKRKGLT